MSTMERSKSWLPLLYALPAKHSSQRVNLWRIGMDRVLKGWARRSLNNEQLLEKGGACLDALYEHLRR